MKNPSSRFLALLTVSALSATALLQPVPAHADKAKTYKYGAIALGVAGGYLLSKGKTVSGAAVLGAGAYAYKKGEDTRKAEKYDRYGYNSGNRNRDRYSYNNGSGYNNGSNGSGYNKGDNGAGPRYNDRYPTNTNGNYNNSNGTYRADRDRADRYRDDRNRDRDDVRLR